MEMIVACLGWSNYELLSNKIMKQVWTFAGVIAIVVGCAAVKTRTAAPSVVTVSLQRVATQSDAGRRASQQMETLRQERGRELTAKQKELDDVVRQLTRTDGLPAADRERLTQDENRRRAELQQLTQQAQAALQSTQTQLQTEIRGQ